MKFQHLLEKLIKTDEKIQENILKTVNMDELPPDLLTKAAKAKEWMDEAPTKLGKAEVPEMAPNIDPMLDYANALGLYQDMFDNKAKSEIELFKELVKELFNDVKEPDPYVS